MASEPTHIIVDQLYIYFKQKEKVDKKIFRKTIQKIIGQTVVKMKILQDDNRTCRSILRFNSDVSKFLQALNIEESISVPMYNGASMHFEKVTSCKPRKSYETYSESKKRRWYWWWINQGFDDKDDN